MFFIGLKATIQEMQIYDISNTYGDWCGFASRKSMQFPVFWCNTSLSILRILSLRNTKDENCHLHLILQQWLRSSFHIWAALIVSSSLLLRRTIITWGWFSSLYFLKTSPVSRSTFPASRTFWVPCGCLLNVCQSLIPLRRSRHSAAKTR